MYRLLLSLTGLLGLAALAGGVLHFTQLDDRGEMHFRPRIDDAALDWYVDQARALLAAGDAGTEEASAR